MPIKIVRLHCFSWWKIYICFLVCGAKLIPYMRAFIKCFFGKLNKTKPHTKHFYCELFLSNNRVVLTAYLKKKRKERKITYVLLRR